MRQTTEAPLRDDLETGGRAIGSDDQPLLQVTGVTKRFGPVLANDDAGLSVLPGEIHALVGENGAGKSTLMNIIYGLVRADGGEIRVRGEAVTIDRPSTARKLGIGMVHQHFKLVPSQTVVANLFLGDEHHRFGILDRKRALAAAVELIDRHGYEIDPNARIEDLSVGSRQRVEILRALANAADLLILDEPTAVLTPQETDALLDALDELRGDGRAIVLITHKLREVKRTADRVTIMRGGRTVAAGLDVASVTEEEMARHMVGRPVRFAVDKAAAEPGKTRLRVDDLDVLDDSGRQAVTGVSLSVRAGEVVGIAGVEGNGQTELVEAIVGLRRPARGGIELDGVRVESMTVAERRARGLGYIPEDRNDRGVSPAMSIDENLSATHMDAFRGRFGSVRTAARRRWVEEMIERYDIRGARPGLAVAALSGGNTQKLVLARELESNPPVIVISQPTRGVDVGAMEYVHQAIIDQRDGGAAVLLVSSELSEILSLSDRILVMFGGRVVADLAPDEATEDRLGLYMAGLSSQEAAS